MIARIFLTLVAVLWAATSSFAACPATRQNQIEVYPTAGVLPENTLRLYIYFPYPMDLDEGQKNIRLLDGNGAPIEGAFLTNRDDLWSPDRRRLTLLFDPGRVKTGLLANEKLGRALKAGNSYKVELSAAMRYADGCQHQSNIYHEFKAKAADLDTPDPGQWQLDLPAIESLEPLRVSLGSAHDHLSMAYRLRVVDARAKFVPGRIALGKNEESWEFIPHEPWMSEKYYLVIDERLEDLAGNRPGVLFDRPLDQAPTHWENRLEFQPET